jgi:nucleotidyltransferase/DNA polymerase involved in DNA repair
VLYPLTRDLEGIDTAIQTMLGSQYSFRAGVAGLPIVAWAAASQAPLNQIYRVDPGQEIAFWDGISIAWIPWLGPRRKKDMLEMGIRTVGDFLSLGPAQAKALWGPDAAKCWRWLMGVESPSAATKTASRRFERVFPRTTYRHGQVLEGLDSACQEAASWLRHSGFTPSTLVLAIRYPDGSGQRGRISLNTVINDRDFFRRGQLILSQIWTRRVRLDRFEAVFSAFQRTNNQLSLFNTYNWDRIRKLGNALDGVRNRYGYGAINYGSSLALAG